MSAELLNWRVQKLMLKPRQCPVRSNKKALAERLLLFSNRRLFRRDARIAHDFLIALSFRLMKAPNSAGELPTDRRPARQVFRSLLSIL